MESDSHPKPPVTHTHTHTTTSAQLPTGLSGGASLHGWPAERQFQICQAWSDGRSNRRCLEIVGNRVMFRNVICHVCQERLNYSWKLSILIVFDILLERILEHRWSLSTSVGKSLDKKVCTSSYFHVQCLALSGRCHDSYPAGLSPETPCSF